MAIQVTGRTFQHRDLFKAWRGRWDQDGQSWQFDSLSSVQLTTLRGMVGLSIVELPDVRPEPFSFDLGEIIRSIASGDDDTPLRERDGTTRIYGDDERYLNYFADKNPTAFFGFSNLSAFVDYVASLRRPGDRRDDGWQDRPRGWHGTPDMPAALRLAREGWADAIEAADSLTIPHAKARKRSYSVAGGSVSVGRLLAGNPAHMIHRPRQPGRKVVTLFVETFMSSGIDPDNAITRAILIGRIADTLEQEGYSCEIVAVLTTSAGREVGHQAAITLKQAGERLSLLDVAFALGHPSFFRRLCFACVGASNTCRTTWATQGMPTAAFNSRHPTRSNEFYIPQLSLKKQRLLDDDDPLSMLPLIEPVGLPITLRSE